jgi:hypothetical protein
MTRTLFIVSNKSGTTTEPNALKDYFFARVAETVGKDKAGGHCFPSRLSGPAQPRRAIFDALAVRPGARRGDRFRSAGHFVKMVHNGIEK